jgi:hypothetical protein
MTPQESSMLQDLIRRVQETQLTEKDPEAEQFLQQALGQNPDAIYILAQTVLVQNMALNQARAQLQQLQQQQQQRPEPARATSFLGSLLGHRDPAPAAPPPPQYQAAPPQPQYQQVPAYEAAPQYAQPGPYASPNPSPAGSFMRSAATTAAGVAAGALAFEGIESLMHGFGHGGGGWGGGGYGSGFGAPPVEETVINNYYDEPSRDAGGFNERREHEASFDERPGDFRGGESERGEQAHLSDASYDSSTDTSLDDSQSDSFSSGDDLSSNFGDDDSNFS